MAAARAQRSQRAGHKTLSYNTAFVA